MKVSEIAAGNIYFNGKDSVREVLALGNNSAIVHYRLLAARQEQEWSTAAETMVSVIGREASCKIESFAAWAKEVFSHEAGQQLLLLLQAKKIKLSPGEKDYMQSALEEAGGAVTVGTHIQFDHTEGRAVSGLEKKGLVVRQKGEVEVTHLGEAWFMNAAQATITD